MEEKTGWGGRKDTEKDGGKGKVYGREVMKEENVMKQVEKEVVGGDGRVKEREVKKEEEERVEKGYRGRKSC